MQKKLKRSKLWTKHVLFRFFGARIWKTIVISRINTFSQKNKKYLILAQKKPSFGISELELLRNYCHIWNQHPEIICKILQKELKMSKLGTKNDLFVFFWTRIWKSYCYIWNWLPGICVIAKFCKRKKKCINFKPTLSYLGSSGLEF